MDQGLTCPTCLVIYPRGQTQCPEHGDLIPAETLPKGDPLLAAGTMVGEYEVVSLLGEGGFGRVYKTKHPVIGKMAAVKVLNHQYSSNPQMVSRFVTEARAVNQIKHPNIVDIFSFGMLPDERRFLSMELLEGSTLEALIQGSAIDLSLAITILRAVALALEAAHAVGIIHRDIKPENVFLAVDSKKKLTPKLLDFGIAKLVGEGVSSATKTGTMIGTPRYMSPEQARGKVIDSRSDIFSFGVVAYEMLTGRLPFVGDNPADLALSQATSGPPLPSSIQRDLPPQLDAPLLAMLALDPAQRPASIAEALTGLEVALLESGIRLSEPAFLPFQGPRKFVHSSPSSATVEEMPAKAAPGPTGAVSSLRELTATSRTPEGIAEAPAKSRAPLWVVGAALLLGAGLLAREMSMPMKSLAAITPPATASSAPLLAPPTASSAAPEPSAALAKAEALVETNIEVSVQGAPAGALVREKGKLLGEAPGPFKMPRASGSTSLTISAPGYKSIEVSLVPSANMILSAPLQRATEAAAVGKKIVAPMATPKELDNPFLAMHTPRGLALALVFCAGLGCKDLPDRPAGQCGNVTVEDKEDCDTFNAGPGTLCGPPGSANECRWLCAPQAGALGELDSTLASQAPSTDEATEQAQARCPVGFGCGLDGVCRASSARFVEAGERLSLLHRVLDSGDFDGDGLADTVTLTDYDGQGQRTARLVFSSASGAHMIVSLPVLVSALLVDDINGDQRADLLFSHTDGFSALLGQQGRTLEAVAYPTFELPNKTNVRLFSANADPDKIGEELFGILFQDSTASLVYFAQLDDLNTATIIAPLGALTPDDLIFPPALGRLGAEACLTAVFTIKSRQELLLWPSCQAEQQSLVINRDAPTALPLPEGVDPVSAQIADTDGDGLLDLIVPAEGQLWVALGDGKGGVQQGASGSPWSAVPLPPEAGSLRPLVVQDLNGDGRVDFVMPDRLTVSILAADGYRIAFQREGSPWSGALSLDLNADSILDVAAASDQSFDVDFLLQTTNGLFTGVTGRSEGPISFLTAGDFDGDDVADVAFVSSLHTSQAGSGGAGSGGASASREDPRQDSLAIAFGRPHASPEPPVRVARLAGVQALATGHLERGVDYDNATELVAIQSTPQAVVLFEGNGDREFLAPYVFRDSTIEARSVALTTLHFPDRSPAILALAREPSGVLRLWSTGAFDARSSDLIYSVPLPEQMLVGAALLGDTKGALVATAELIPGQGTRIVVAASLGEGLAGVGLLMATLKDGAFVLGPLQTFDAMISQDSKLLLRDTNSDGQVEVVLLTGSNEEPGDLLVLQGDTELKLVARVVVPGGASAFACRRNNRGGCQLFVINEAGTYQINQNDSFEGAIERVNDLPGGKAITAADFDGDGLDDLAIGDGDQIRFFVSVAVRP